MAQGGAAALLLNLGGQEIDRWRRGAVVCPMTRPRIGEAAIEGVAVPKIQNWLGLVPHYLRYLFHAPRESQESILEGANKF
jgi:hypothetical protein